MSSILSLLSLSILAISSSVVAFGPLPVNLGTAANYAVLAETGVSTVPPSSITGAVGLSPAANTFLTGFSPTLDSTGTFSTSTQVVGQIFAASYKSPTPSTLATAVADSNAAYNDASTRLLPDFLNLGGGAIGGLTLTPGLYQWTSGVTIDSDVTIFGTALDTWIFQITGNFNIAAAEHIVLLGSLASNIVWVVGGSVVAGAGAQLEGVFLSKTTVTLDTGASLNGRILAQSAATLQKATVVAPA